MNSDQNWQQTLAARLPALRARGGDAARLDGLISRLEAALKAGQLTQAQADAALARLAEVAQPADTLLYMLQFCADPHGQSVLAEPGALDTLITLSAQGEHPAHVLQRHPDDLAYLAAERHNSHLSGGGRGLDALIDELNQRLDTVPGTPQEREEAVFAELRRLKRRESMRIYLREIDHASSMRQTASEIAQLAQACLEVACVRGAELLGRPELIEHFCVLGMGKLGGMELNFSSDIDLIFVCSNWICTDDGALEQDQKSQIDHLARWVTRALGDITDDGYVFRVDLRLRPEGSKGALVNSVGAMVDYYLNWGSTWERSAMIKARPVGGNHALGDELLGELEPFIYRRYLDFKVLDDLRAMKAQIDRHAHVSAVVGIDEAQVLPQFEPTKPVSSMQTRLRKKLSATGALRRTRRKIGIAGRVSLHPSRAAVEPDRPSPADRTLEESPGDAETPAEPGRARRAGSPFGWDVKIGVGGIREIEFFVQALQLVHSGTRDVLRVRATLDALDRLLYAGLITHEDHTLLTDAYDLFRRVEHRIQMERDRQSHRLPEDMAGFSRLARRMGLDEAELRERITYFRRHVAAIFERLFSESAQTSQEPTVRESRPSELVTVLGVTPEHLFDPAVLDALVALGFRRPRQVAGQLQVLRERSYGPFGARAGTEQSQLSRYILQACASAPDPDQAFSHWARLSTRLGDRPGFYDMLFENPHATRLLVHVFGSSEFLTSIVLREPNVIDYLLGADTVAIVRERADMARELERRLVGIADPSHRLGRVRRFHQEEVLRIALHEVAGACEIGETVRQLSMLAEVLIDAVLREVYANLVSQLAPSPTPPPRVEELGFVVLAMGKLGGRELTFGSDLDVVFVYDENAPHSFEPSFYVRLAQRLVRNLSSLSAQGKMYEVDTRLRPSGRQGILVVSFEAFSDYHRYQADLWERQAMLRARPLTGTPEIRRKLMALREKIAFETPNPPQLAAKMRRMRNRIIGELGSDGAGIDIKADPGAMIDVEFLTQYFQLLYGRQISEQFAEDAPPARGDLALDAHGREAEQTGRQIVSGATSQNAMHALAGLAEAAERGEVDPGVDCVSLLEDYRMLRRVEARLRMNDLRASNRLPTDPSELGVLARRLGYQGREAGAQLRSEIEVLNARISQAFRAVMHD